MLIKKIVCNIYTRVSIVSRLSYAPKVKSLQEL